jgi:RNA polymerase sigma-70 factor (ECF subfamily)
MSDGLASDPGGDEAEIREACAARDYDRAASLTINRYGGELLAFVSARLRSVADGEDVFAAFAEKLWLGLPMFEWRCSLRSWCYRLARNAANDFLSLAHHRRELKIAPEAQARLSQLVDHVRTITRAYLKTAVKDRMQELRETLAPDDQMLLILRVDRGMAWRDLAVALSGEGETPSDAELDKEAARLRKRFERVKDQLRDLARADGLL